MLKDLFLVGMGSFVGGSLRLLISRYIQFTFITSFPIGTMIINVVGCLLIGIFSTLSANHITPSLRLMLTTGFCGGFTTFSTFMNENVSLVKEEHSFYSAIIYTLISLGLGFTAVLAGRQLVLWFR